MERIFKDQDGQTIAATLMVKKKPLVILLGGDRQHTWDQASKNISEAGFHVVAYDLRGHGDSFWSKREIIQ